MPSPSDVLGREGNPEAEESGGGMTVLALGGRRGRYDGIIYPYVIPGLRHVVTRRLRRDVPDMRTANRRINTFPVIRSYELLRAGDRGAS